MTTRGPAAGQITAIEEACSRLGLRLTEQRRVIAQVLTDAVDHPAVEEVHRRASAIDSRISLSTVYRTLKLFNERGILERHMFGEGPARYEEAPDEHHDHLIDIETGRVIDFHNARIEKLQEEIAAELGFRLVGHRLELLGVKIKPGPKK